jgi:hypothetical protein
MTTLSLAGSEGVLTGISQFIQFGRRALFLGRLEIKLPLSLYLAAALACDTLITAAMIFIVSVPSFLTVGAHPHVSSS